MKSSEEMAQSLFARRDAWEKKRRRRRDVMKKSLTGVASVCLTAAVCLGIWYTTEGQTQAAIRCWKKEVRGSYIIYSAGYELTDIELPSYELTWVPAGFKALPDSTEDEKGQAYFYEENYFHEGTRDYFFWKVRFLGRLTASTQLGAERTEERVDINGMDGDLYHRDYPDYGFEISQLFWFDNELGIVFELSGNLSREEIVKVAESMIQVRTNT